MRFAIWCEPDENGIENGCWFGWLAEDGGRQFLTFESATVVADRLNDHHAPTIHQVREWRTRSR